MRRGKRKAQIPGLTILDMPDDVLHSIAEWLSLSDVGSLALSRLRFSIALERECKRWDLPENIETKFRFLQTLDKLHTDWVLCKNCVKFHKWHPSDIDHSKCAFTTDFDDLFPDLYVHRDIDIPAITIALVKRARFYDDPAYGLPIEHLFKRYRTLDGWHIKAEAVFTRENALLIRITTESMKAKRYKNPLKLDFCGCTVRLGEGVGTLEPMYDLPGTVVTKCEEQLGKTFRRRAIIETTTKGQRYVASWHRCLICHVLLSGLVFNELEEPMDWKNSFVRYYDLGPVSVFNDLPRKHYSIKETMQLY